MLHQQQIPRIACLLIVVKFESFKLLLQEMRVFRAVELKIKFLWNVTSFGMLNRHCYRRVEEHTVSIFGSQQSITLKMEALLSY